MRHLAIFFVLCTCVISTASAQSKAAAYLVEQAISDACSGKGGTIKESAAIERDLTGDGNDDLIISHEGISCENGSRSIYCGAQACTFSVYVREGNLLQLKKEMLGMAVTTSTGGVPTIRWYAHGGKERQFRWDGRDFR